jgi:hypothetical protein
MGSTCFPPGRSTRFSRRSTGNDNELTWQGTLFDDGFFGGSDSSRTPVDLSAVGDNAHGLIVTGLADQSGAPITLALVVMWQGRALDLAGSR